MLYMHILFHLMFISSIVIAFMPVLEARCNDYTYRNPSSINIVANSFLYLFGVQLIFSVYVLVFYMTNQFLKTDYKPLEGSLEEREIQCFQ